MKSEPASPQSPGSPPAGSPSFSATFAAELTQPPTSTLTGNQRVPPLATEALEKADSDPSCAASGEPTREPTRERTADLPLGPAPLGEPRGEPKREPTREPTREVTGDLPLGPAPTAHPAPLDTPEVTPRPVLSRDSQPEPLASPAPSPTATSFADKVRTAQKPSSTRTSSPAKGRKKTEAALTASSAFAAFEKPPVEVPPMPGAASCGRRELARQRKLEQLLPPGALQDRFLPMTLEGHPVLLHLGGTTWRAENRLLHAESSGIAFRRTMCLNDKLESLTLPWGSTVEADDEGEGWVKVNAHGYMALITECDRVLDAPPLMQFVVVLKRLMACEAALKAAEMWKGRQMARPTQVSGSMNLPGMVASPRSTERSLNLRGSSQPGSVSPGASRRSTGRPESKGDWDDASSARSTAASWRRPGSASSTRGFSKRVPL